MAITVGSSTLTALTWWVENLNNNFTFAHVTLSKRGNPLGGLMYSNAFSGGNTIQQVIEWTKYAFFALRSSVHSKIFPQLHGGRPILHQGLRCRQAQRF
jgi:hypothetical protein